MKLVARTPAELRDRLIAWLEENPKLADLELRASDEEYMDVQGEIELTCFYLDENGDAYFMASHADPGSAEALEQEERIAVQRFVSIDVTSFPKELPS